MPLKAFMTTECVEEPVRFKVQDDCRHCRHCPGIALADWCLLLGSYSLVQLHGVGEKVLFMKFQLKLHSIRKGVQVVEVRDDNGDLVATITPGETGREIRVTSKHLQNPATQIEVLPAMVRFFL